MRITAIEEYGLRCLLALARKGPGKQLTITEIAELEGLSVPYATKLLSILRRAGLVTAERGRTGGFTITRPLEQISLYEVLVALGGPLIDPRHCQRHSGQLEQCVGRIYPGVPDGYYPAGPRLRAALRHHSASTKASSFGPDAISTGCETDRRGQNRNGKNLTNSWELNHD
jgi:Rrf2 family protein